MPLLYCMAVVLCGSIVVSKQANFKSYDVVVCMRIRGLIWRPVWLLALLLIAAACAPTASPDTLPTLAVLPSVTASNTPTDTSTPTETALPSATASPTTSPTATATVTASASPTNTLRPSATPTVTATPTFAPPATPLSATPVRLLDVLTDVIVFTVARANVRACPALECAVLEELTANVEVPVAALVSGESISGRNQWYLRAVGGGYLHISLVSLTPPQN